MALPDDETLERTMDSHHIQPVDDTTYPLREGNRVQPLIGGEAAFRHWLYIKAENKIRSRLRRRLNGNGQCRERTPPGSHG